MLSSVEWFAGPGFICGAREPSKGEQLTASSKPQISRFLFALNTILTYLILLVSRASYLLSSQWI